MNRFIYMLIGIFIISCIITYILDRIFRKKHIKYIPGGASLGIGIYNVYLGKVQGGDGFEDIARILMALMLFTASLASIFTGLSLDFLLERIKKKPSK